MRGSNYVKKENVVKEQSDEALEAPLLLLHEPAPVQQEEVDDEFADDVKSLSMLGLEGWLADFFPNADFGCQLGKHFLKRIVKELLQQPCIGDAVEIIESNWVNIRQPSEGLITKIIRDDYGLFFHIVIFDRVHRTSYKHVFYDESDFVITSQLNADERLERIKSGNQIINVYNFVKNHRRYDITKEEKEQRKSVL